MFLFKLALFSFPFLSFHFISTCLNTNVFSLFLISLFCHSCTPLNHCRTAEWLILGGHGFTVNFVQNINKSIKFRKNPSVKRGSKNKTVQGKEAVGPSARGPRCETWSKTKVIFLRWNAQKILKVIDNFFLNSSQRNSLWWKFLESDLGQIILVTLAHSWAPTQEARKKTFFF